VATFKLNKISPLVFVKQITHQQQTIGYLNVILEEKEVMNFHSQYQHQIDQQLQMLVILGVIAGILIARLFYKIRYRQLIKNSKA
jgi:membrane protein